MASELAGKPAPKEILIDTMHLLREYFMIYPIMENPAQKVAFGTSGHRGKPSNGSFNEQHIMAIVQAVCEYRQMKGYSGPLFLGKDTHAVSEPAHTTALEVMAGNGVTVIYQQDNGFTPTPVISYSILTYNKRHPESLSDGIVITPSHNPPSDGGIKYNSPDGGPADLDATRWIENRANEILTQKCADVKRKAISLAPDLIPKDLMTPYISDLRNIVDMELIAKSGLRLGVDPLGGAGMAYWQPIAEMYGLDITVVNTAHDPTFSFMPVDHDGKIRMDCSSPYAMANLIGLKDRFDLAFGNDPDTDRHGIVTPSVGLMNPNHYLAVAIDYLFKNRNQWSPELGIGKTLVSSSIIDRVAAGLNRKLVEVPVGFKWFVDGLFHGTIGFGGEESAGASFLRFDSAVWSTDKDGIIMNLLAAEITARTNHDPGIYYKELETRYGQSCYQRLDQTATPEQKNAFKNLTPERIQASELAGEPITGKFTHAPGNNASIGGVKVTTANGWFAARPSGTENIYKIYAESFLGQSHLDQIFAQSREIVTDALQS